MAKEKKFTAADIKKMGLTPSQVKKIIKNLESSIPKAKEKAAKAAIKAGAKKVVDRTTGKTYKPGSKGEILIQGKKYDVASGAADKKMSKLRKAQTPKTSKFTSRGGAGIGGMFGVKNR